MEEGGFAGPAPRGVERVLYVVEGGVDLILRAAPAKSLGPGGFAYCPPDTPFEMRATATSSINVFEKRYVIRRGFSIPEPVFGVDRDVEGTPFMGDPTRYSKYFCPATRGMTWLSMSSPFSPGRRSRWSRSM